MPKTSSPKEGNKKIDKYDSFKSTKAAFNK